MTRTTFLESVPFKATRGIEGVRIRLGVVQPGESISIYNDALGRLEKRLQFLYSSGEGRYWFDVQPNLIRTHADRSSRVTDDDVLDLNLRQSFYSDEIIETSLRFADILKLNEEEFKLVMEIFSVSGKESDVLSQLLEDFDLQLIALTKGENGSVLYSKKETSFEKFQVENIVDTVGAGDSFTGVLIMGLLNNIPLNDIHRKAAEISAFVCTRKGAMPGIPEDLILWKK